MVNNPAYFTNPNAFGPPVQSLAEQLAGQGFLSPGMQGPGEEMFYGFSPEAQGMMGSSDNRMYAGQSITPELMRYMAQSWGGGRMSPDQLRKAFPSFLHPFMPQFDPITKVRYDQGSTTYKGGLAPTGVKTAQGGFTGSDINQTYLQPQGPVLEDTPAQYKYTYANPIAAPKFQELPSISIQKQMGQEAEQQAETEVAERERERSGLLRSGAGRNIFGQGRT